MSAASPFINIKAKANRHALFLMLIGANILILTLLFSHYYWLAYRLILIFFYLLAFVIILTGLFKYSEPKSSFYLTPQGLQYNHRYGIWHLQWQQIHTINIIKEVVGLTTIELPYIGIRMKNLEPLVDQISPRLANALIHEQQPLLSFAVRQQLLALEQTELNFKHFPLQSGRIIKGPLAAFLYHCQTLQLGLGYHLYIPETSSDRELREFCQLLKQCKIASANYPPENIANK